MSSQFICVQDELYLRKKLNYVEEADQLKQSVKTLTNTLKGLGKGHYFQAHIYKNKQIFAIIKWENTLLYCQEVSTKKHYVIHSKKQAFTLGKKHCTIPDLLHLNDVLESVHDSVLNNHVKVSLSHD